MRSISHALKATIGCVGLVAALLGAVAAPAHAEASGPATTAEEAVRQAGISAGISLPLPPEMVASATPTICFSGHVQNVGWQLLECDDGGNNLAYAGTEGRGLRLEALRVAATGTGGVTCVQAHVQNENWHDPVCVHDNSTAQVGTFGKNLRMESVAFSSTTRRMCAEAHMQNYGWIGEVCQPANKTVVVGVDSLSLRMEAVRGKID